MEYEKILLSDVEQLAFNKFMYCDTATLSKSEFQILKAKGLIAGSINGKSDWFDDLPQSGICEISDLGKNLRLYQHNQKILTRKENRRYRINTALSIIALLIASASLIVSIFALLKS